MAVIYDIPLPRLLNSSGGTERRIRPNNVAVDLKAVPLSYATIELPAGESLPARGYVEVFTCLGSAGIYRVRSPQDAYGDDITTAELEHAIVEVGDWVIKADYDEMMSASTAMTTVFSHYRGTKWQLGSVSALGSGQIALKQKYTRVLEGMLAILEQAPGCILAFDFSTTPWTVSVTTRDTTVTAEGRLSRNVNSARVIYDDTELCTRAYYEYATTDGSGEATSTWAFLDADTVSTYGVVERDVPTGHDYTQTEALRVATEYLRQHKNPKISVDISGEELSNITGEPLDTFTIGKMFRLALTDYNTTIEQNITGLSWASVYDAPQEIQVMLGEEEDTAVTFLHDIDAKGGSIGGGGGLRKEDDVWKEFRTEFQKTDMYLDLYAQQLNDANEILRQAGMYIDAHGVLVYADDYETNVGSKLHVLADQIDSSVYAASSAIYSSIVQTASSITSTIVDTEQNLYNYIQQTASGTRQIITATTNKVWIQDVDPRTSAGGSHNPKNGDFWIESTHQGSWDGAEGFDWDHDEDYDWNQIQGSKVWGWANNKWELVSDQQQVVSYADVVNTAEHYLSLRIKGIVNDQGLLEVYLSKLEQTGDELKSEIYAASSQLYSFIDQTVSSINMGVGSRAVTVRQTTEPTDIYGRAPVNNDIWIETQHQETWDKALNFSWNDDYEVDWNELRSDRIHVYDATEQAWVDALDGTVLADDTDLQIASDHIALLARNIDTLDSYARENFSQLKVEASRISTTVLDKTNQLGSRISQTATQIRSEVWAAQSTVYSEIVQTASNIYLHVANTASGLQSSINVEANAINLLVEGRGSGQKIKPANIVAAINEGASSVVISADHINLDGYVKATDLTATSLSAIFTSANWLEVYNLKVKASLQVTYATGQGSSETVGFGTLVKDLQIVQSGNTYTLQKKRADSGTWTYVGSFSRATTLSGAWSGNTYTVTASPQGNTHAISIATRLGASSGQYYVEAYQSNASGAPTISGTALTIPVETKTITSNGTYTPSSGKVGFSSVTVNVSGGSVTADDINLYPNGTSDIIRSASAPSGATALTSLATILKQAYNNQGGAGHYVRFKATVDGGTGAKWYYMNMTP